MIPERVALRGFLCYRDEQEILLDGSTLWLLAGMNGSGKSAVFDAVTFALFGGHRGGLQGAQALINKGCDGLAVEFEFRLDNRAYRIRRTLKRGARGRAGSGTQQIYRFEAGENGKGKWEAVPDTTNRAGFDAWIRDNIGLTFETFTSSVLLMQGRAEKLLSAAPKERFEVLAGVVGLDRFQRLHKRADDRRRKAEEKAEALKHQLQGLPEVAEEEWTLASDRLDTARGAVDQARAEVNQLHRLEVQAEQWGVLQGKMAEVERERQGLEDLLGRAESIERDAARLHALRVALPLLGTAQEQLGRIGRAEQARRDIDQDRARLSARQAEIESESAQLLQRCEEREQRAAEAGQRARTAAERAHALQIALLHLKQVHRERTLLLSSIQERDDGRKQQGERLADAERLLTSHAEADRALRAASTARQAAEHHVTQRRTLFDESEKRWQRFDHVVGEKICRYCGQALTPAHVHDERTKLEAERVQAGAAYQAAVTAADEASRAEAAAREAFESLNRRLTEVRQAAAAFQQQADAAGRAADRHAQQCREAFAELASPFRERVAGEQTPDWAQTSYPTEADLRALQAEQDSLRAEAGALAKAQEADRREAHRDAEQSRRLEEERTEVQRRLAELDVRRAEQEVRLKGARELLADTRQALAADWQRYLEDPALAELLARWQQEREGLERSGSEGRLRALRQAAANIEALRNRRAELEREAEAIPPEARLDVGQVHGRVAAAQEQLKDLERERDQAQQARERVLHQREQRERLDVQVRGADREVSLTSKLAELLGRNFLQLHLVRQAERSVVSHANAVLDRLSAGQLYLRLQRPEGEEEPDQVLALEAYNRATGDAPIGVAFLSGSQRFRVAVALALGLGQYASRSHRPIESVIIDEGFGCLDRQGRQVMIQELHNLKGQLRSILLVSHQEEFADAFPDGYHFELVDGSTVATRFEQ